MGPKKNVQIIEGYVIIVYIVCMGPSSSVPDGRGVWMIKVWIIHAQIIEVGLYCGIHILDSLKYDMLTVTLPPALTTTGCIPIVHSAISSWSNTSERWHLYKVWWVDFQNGILSLQSCFVGWFKSYLPEARFCKSMLPHFPSLFFLPSLSPTLPQSLHLLSPCSSPPPSLPPSSSLFLQLCFPLLFTTSWCCIVMFAISKHSMLVKRLHMPVRLTRVTCYDFLTQGRESYYGELVTASEWNISLVIHVTCEFAFFFFLNLVLSLKEEKRIEVSHCYALWYTVVMWLSHGCHTINVFFSAANWGRWSAERESNG